MPAGRPSKYKPEFADEMRKYFDVPTHVNETPAVLPTLAAFCCTIGVCRDTVWRWSKEHAEFSDALKDSKEHQERILVENALAGRYDKAFAIFTAKNLINWRDKNESIVKHGVDEESVDDIERITQVLASHGVDINEL